MDLAKGQELELVANASGSISVFNPFRDVFPSPLSPGPTVFNAPYLVYCPQLCPNTEILLIRIIEQMIKIPEIKRKFCPQISKTLPYHVSPGFFPFKVKPSYIF